MKKIVFLIPLALILSACDKPTRNEQIQEKLNQSKEFKTIHMNDYSKADTKIVVNGAGGLVSIRDKIDDVVSVDLKVPFDEVKIISSNDNFFRVIGDKNVVETLNYTKDKQILKVDLKAMVGAMQNPLKMEIYSNKIQYFDNNSENTLLLSGNYQNITIQNKGFLTINLDKASFKDFMTTNLGKIEINGNGNAENLYLTDFSLGQYNLENFRAKNLGIKTRGINKGTLNIYDVATGEVGFLSEYNITGNTRIKKINIMTKGKVIYK